MKKNICLTFIVLLALTSCKRLLEPGQPATQMDGAAVYNNDITATAAMLGVYSQFESDGVQASLSIITGLSSDELTLRNTAAAYVDIFNNNLTADNSLTQLLWNEMYRLLYQVNAVGEGLNRSMGVSGAVRKQLEGEVHFMRGLLHFYLVGLYGPVPIVTSTSYEQNARIARSDVSVVFKFIKEELTQASDLLAPEYKGSNNEVASERVRPTRWAAEALLARVFLYMGEWQHAADAASNVISQSAVYELQANLANVFLRTSKEQIWQLQATRPNYNTVFAVRLPPSSSPSIAVLNKKLVREFPLADKRPAAWITVRIGTSDSFYFPFKYKQGLNAPSVTEYTSILRLAEQHLIRSEALVMLNKADDALLDINKIRLRAGLDALNQLSTAAMLDSIFVERKRELFMENADRWLDLKRSGRADSIMTLSKPGNFTPDDKLYPIPLTDILRNNLLTQNPGY